jgi:hypothetical protein
MEPARPPVELAPASEPVSDGGFSESLPPQAETTAVESIVSRKTWIKARRRAFTAIN